MPWTETRAMDLRSIFVTSALRQEVPMSELCLRYNISRKTGYKWLARYHEGGTSALVDRSHAPREPRCAVSPEAEALVLALREQRPSWGPRKLLARLGKDHPGTALPAASTVGDLLRRHGLTQPRRRRDREPVADGGLLKTSAANESWSADFKGWFRTGDGVRCEPLTVTDNHTRYLMVCHAVPKLSIAHVQPLFEQAFREHGLPVSIRTDNGSPFCKRDGLAGLTRLSVWFLTLDIWPDRIPPGRPDRNGRHERMHRTLAQDEACRPAATLPEMQQQLDRWRADYNGYRPHEALDQRCPAELYRSSPRPYPTHIRPWEYAADHHVRRVSASGYITWRDQPLYLTEALRGQTVAIAQRDDGNWVLRFRNFDLAILADADARLFRSGLARAGQAGTKQENCYPSCRSKV
jgi:putative transposase